MTNNTVKQGYETSEITRQHIIETAEKMFLEQGIDAVSDRAILREAGQRNLSALKYHFGGRDGLISAIRERRDLRTETRRREILEQVTRAGSTLTIRQACEVLIETVVSLCRKDPSHRAYLACFGQYLIANPRSLLDIEPVTQSMETLVQAIVDQSPGMDLSLLLMRLENSNALGLLALTRRAQSGDSFRGRDAEMFLENLLDQIEGMLQAPVSAKTEALINQKK